MAGDRPEDADQANAQRDDARGKSRDAAAPSGGEKSQDADLSARIEAARRALEPEAGPSAAEKYNSLTLAWRMTLELVVGSAMGFGIGWGLDSLFGTKPFLMLVFGLLGFAAGIKLVYETAQASSRNSAMSGRAGGGVQSAKDDEGAGGA
ncbi:MAG: AtpZ/AtpI family protein [Pseudomonadota bacterium]